MSRTEKFSDTLAFKIASIVVLSAIVTIFTYVVRIPVAPTGGNLNFSDVAIFFVAFTFGPIPALIASAIGTATANLISGYAQWAPFTFFIRGLEGFLIGVVYNILIRENSRINNIFLQSFLCFLVGAFVMVTGYFIAGTFLVGPGAALLGVPGDIVQALVGVVGGMSLAVAVKKAYPPVIYFRW